MKTLVLGAGKMVSAILEGLTRSEGLPDYYLYSPSGVSAEALSKKVKARWVKSLDEIDAVDVVWLGCKPQQLKDLAASLPSQFKSATFVSMLAAIPEQDLIDILGVRRVIRIMPNLPVKFRSGVTLISSKSTTTVAIQKQFEPLGLSKVVTEAELEELTMLTSAGPALFYEFTSYLAQSFSSLNETDREDLARMILQGAGMASSKSTDSLSDMISGVTSKGGVTIAVLEKWREIQLAKSVKTGVDAGLARSGELKALLRQN